MIIIIIIIICIAVFLTNCLDTLDTCYFLLNYVFDHEQLTVRI